MPVEELRDDDPGQVGPYRVLARLGEGGMGVVYLVVADGGLGALKLVRAQLAGNDEFRARFRREVNAGRAVSGDHIARFLDSELEGEQPYLVSEYVAGPTLAESVEANGPLVFARVLDLAGTLALALATIHRAGVVHRDLKPSNVVLGTEGPCIIDFGVARALGASRITETGLPLGSAPYMSPEAALGKEVGPPADVFAWAGVVSFAATGRPPFGLGRPEVVLLRVVHEEPDLEGVDPRLETLLRSAFERDPTMRPTAADLSRSLGASVAERVARPPAWAVGRTEAVPVVEGILPATPATADVPAPATADVPPAVAGLPVRAPAGATPAEPVELAGASDIPAVQALLGVPAVPTFEAVPPVPAVPTFGAIPVLPAAPEPVSPAPPDFAPASPEPPAPADFAPVSPEPPAPADFAPASPAPYPRRQRGRRLGMVAGAAATAVVVAAGGVFAAYRLTRPGTTTTSTSTSSIPTGTTLLTQGAAGPDAAIPWGDVGAGWSLALWSPNGTTGSSLTLFLLDPAGGRYTVRTGLPWGTTIADWSGSKLLALLTEPPAGGATTVLQVALHGGGVSQQLAFSALDHIQFTRPDGLALLVSQGGGASQTGAVLSLYELDGKLHGTFASSFSAVGDADGSAIDTLDGTQVVVGADAGVAFVSNDTEVTTTPTQVVVPGGHSCRPLKWWSPGVVLVYCKSVSPAYGMWLVPASGATPVRLAGGTASWPLDLWQAGATVYGLFSSGTCSSMFLGPLQADGLAGTPVSPPVAGAPVVVGAHQTQLEVMGGEVCPSSSNPHASLAWYNPSTGASTTILGGAVAGGSVEDAFLYPAGGNYS